MSNAVSLRPPKYRRHKAKGLALVTINGRDIYLGKYGSAESKEEYRRLIAEYLLSGYARSLGDSQEITVVEVMAAYLQYAKEYYRKGGEVTREYGLIVECCRAIRPLYGRSQAGEFGPLALKAVRQSMIEAGHSRKYINKNIERIRRMFKWAAAEELIPAAVPQALWMVTGLRQGRTTARETAPVLPVEDAIVDATVPYLPVVVADMVRLQRLTGMRPGEVCDVRPCDIDRTSDVWIFQPRSHKTEHHGRKRTIFIGPKAQQILLRYLARDAQTHCFRPCDSEEKRRAERHAARATPLSCGNVPGSNRCRQPKRRAGEKYSTDSYRRAIARACDLAFPHRSLGSTRVADLTEKQLTELEEWRKTNRWAPNQLRHTAGTEIRRSFGLEAAQVVLGHAQADVTQIYAERDLEKGKEVARLIG